jgi:biotin carboxylase
MRHVVFVEVNRKGIGAIESALGKSLKVTFVYAHKYKNLFNLDLERLKHLNIDIEECTDTIDKNSLLQKLVEINRVKKIDHLIGLFDLNVETIAYCAKELDIFFTSYDSVCKAKSKVKTREALAASGLNNLRWVNIKSKDDIEKVGDEFFPAILKPVSLGGSINVSKCLSRAHCLQLYDQARDTLNSINIEDLGKGDYILEEFADGALYSSEVLAINGDYSILCSGQRKTYSKNSIVELGTTCPPICDDSTVQLMESYAMDVCKALGLDHGIFHVEYILSGGKPVLVEANPRLMGGNGPVTISHMIQQNVFDVLVTLFCEKKVLNFKKSSTSITSRVLAPGAPGKLNSNVDLEFLSPFRKHIKTLNFDKDSLPECVESAENNFDILGSFEVVANSPQESLKVANEIQRLFENALGIKLAE